MQYYIYGPVGIKLGLLQDVTSIQWNPRYYDSGQFEIHARPTEFNMKYLCKKNRIVCRDRNEIGFIEYVYCNEKDDDMEIRGHMDNLEDRINTSTVKVTNVEKSLLDAVSANKRGLDIFVGTPTGLTATIADGSESTWKTLREMIQTYCKIVGYGYREIVKDGKLNYLEIYSGQRKVNARFSDKLGNVLSQKYIEDMTEYKNFAYVLGEEKDGEARTMVTVDMRSENEPMYELYVDARDIQTTYTDSDGNSKERTAEEIKQLLTQRGNEKLNEARQNASTFEFELKENDTLVVLGSDYDLGDIVSAVSSLYSIYIEARIVGLNFVEEGDQDMEVSLELEITNQEVIR
jgi:hypothetical protein